MHTAGEAGGWAAEEVWEAGSAAVAAAAAEVVVVGWVSGAAATVRGSQRQGKVGREAGGRAAGAGRGAGEAEEGLEGGVKGVPAGAREGRAGRVALAGGGGAREETAGAVACRTKVEATEFRHH